MTLQIKTFSKAVVTPELDEDFVPAAIYNRNYRESVNSSGSPEHLSIALIQPDNSTFLYNTVIHQYNSRSEAENNFYIERIVKFLLWQKGGYKILLSNKIAADFLARTYAKDGHRAFDYEFFSRKIYDSPLQIQYCPVAEMPQENSKSKTLGRNLEGCRIGFDLGGSDRKCAAVVDGKVMFSEEIKWNPYFQSDPQYHINGINDSLKRAAAKLPRVDAIGGSAAGVYVENRVRVASLFRGISEEDFKKHINPLFINLAKEWNVPLEVVNDGEVTALAGSMSLNANAVLGISMGTSVAAGYVTPAGNITSWLNELAFVPVDYRDRGPVDEWSGDAGCAVQYFCQQGVARLAPLAGLEFPQEMPFAERLAAIQDLLDSGDQRAADIFSTIGTYLGYTIAHFADFYDFRHLLILGRVTSGAAGSIIISGSKEVLLKEFPELYERINVTMPDEKMKRHGQAVAAASLPAVN